MLKHFRFFALAMMCLFGSHAVSAQGIGKYLSRPDIGIGVNAYTTSEKGSIGSLTVNDNATVGHYSIMADFNFPVYELTEHMSAGIMPGLSFGVSPNKQTTTDAFGNQYGDGGGQSANLSIPLFATFKLNNDATWKGNDGFTFGLAAGIGYIYHMFTYIGDGGGTGHSFGSPSYMAEVNFGEHHSTLGLLKLRYIGSLGSGFNETNNGLTSTVANPGSVYLIMTLGY